MKFGDPFYFHLLWALVPLLFFLIWGHRKKEHLALRDAEASQLRKKGATHGL